MVMTYDFVPMAQRDNILLEKIKHALLSQADEICEDKIIDAWRNREENLNLVVRWQND